MSPAVARALAYPFAPRADAFVLDRGRARAFDPDADRGLTAGRTPVLGVGSNASPQRLIEKFGTGARVAVTRAAVADHVVAHSAKFTAYGSMPASLHPWAGATAHVSVTWLDADQLAAMDKTETLGVEYDRLVLAAMLHGVAADPGLVCHTYISRLGALGESGRPVASAAATLDGHGDLVSLDQRGAQLAAMAILKIEAPLEAFVAENLADKKLRRARSQQLSEAAGLPYAPGRS